LDEDSDDEARNAKLGGEGPPEDLENEPEFTESAPVLDAVEEDGDDQNEELE